MKYQPHKFNYRWTLKDAVFTKDKGKVFSCFACGGGSSMGYKLSGYDVIGCNEIDPRMMYTYCQNHNPRFNFLEPIQTFKLRDDLPDELYQLDILDGSPPCSTFSIAGSREDAWGVEKKFREGQASQVLDTLFFDFIDLAKKLQPKVVIAENVKVPLSASCGTTAKGVMSHRAMRTCACTARKPISTSNMSILTRFPRHWHQRRHVSCILNNPGICRHRKCVVFRHFLWIITFVANPRTTSVE